MGKPNFIRQDRLGVGPAAFTITRRAPAQHGKFAESLMGMAEQQFLDFLDEIERTPLEENTLRLATIDSIIARAQVHATLATAPLFNGDVEPDEAPDNAVQADLSDDVTEL